MRFLILIATVCMFFTVSSGAKGKKLSQEITLKIKHSIKLADGLEIRFEGISIEQSEPPPGSKEPSEAGVNVTLSLSTPKHKKGQVFLSRRVSSDTMPSAPVEWEGYKIVLLGTRDEYREAEAKVLVKRN